MGVRISKMAVVVCAKFSMLTCLPDRHLCSNSGSIGKEISTLEVKSFKSYKAVTTQMYNDYIKRILQMLN